MICQTTFLNSKANLGCDFNNLGNSHTMWEFPIFFICANIFAFFRVPILPQTLPHLFAPNKNTYNNYIKIHMKIAT